MKRISTHVLDTAQGAPARNVPVRLERQEASGDWRLLASARTDADGRCSQLLPEGEALSPGIYRLTFDTASYHAAQKIESLYPLVQITFAVKQGDESFHIPLLLSPHGYTTYRGN
jgi:5-hydroxyisourate hydrolase